MVTLLAYAGVSVVVAERVTKPYRRALASSPAVFGLQYEDVTFPSTGDAVTLRGWFLPAKGSDRVVVVIVHGRNSNRAGDHGELVPHAEALVERGYNALLFDFRGHGESGGVRYTLGAVEQRDVLGAVAYLESRGFAPARMGFWAHSMGAATVLLTSAASPDVRTIVADSSFARLHDLLDRQLPFASDLPSFFNPSILYFARTLFNADARIVNPEDAVAGLPPDSLFQHHDGVADLGFPQPANDPGRLGRPEADRQAANGGLVPDAPQDHGPRRAAQGTGDQLGQGRLAAAGRPGEAQDRGPGGRPGGAYDETAQRDRGRALPATGPGAPRARPSRVHAVDVSRRVARNRRMRALISGRLAWAASSSAIAGNLAPEFVPFFGLASLLLGVQGFELVRWTRRQGAGRLLGMAVGVIGVRVLVLEAGNLAPEFVPFFGLASLLLGVQGFELVRWTRRQGAGRLLGVAVGVVGVRVLVLKPGDLVVQGPD